MIEPSSGVKIRPREGFIPWLRRIIAGNLLVDIEVARLRQELEWANARADKAERNLEMAAEAAVAEERARCAAIARSRSNYSGLHPFKDLPYLIAAYIERGD